MLIVAGTFELAYVLVQDFIMILLIIKRTSAIGTIHGVVESPRHNEQNEQNQEETK